MALRPPPGLHKRPIFEPQCTHLSMTRIYSPELLCESCHRSGPFGWLYQCTQDRDDFLEHLAARGNLSHLDLLGCSLTSQMTVRRASPAAREDPLSFFSEVTQEQMAHYKPDQIARILKQRENVRLIIQGEFMRLSSAAILNRLAHSNAIDGPLRNYDYRKPWVRGIHDECQYRVCLRCRPSCDDRAYLSLNAVAEGEILPTAATGYGFHILGDRPVMDANIVKNLGSRPAPMPPSDMPCTKDSYHSSPTSSISVMEFLDGQIAQSQRVTDRNKVNTVDSAESSDSDDDVSWPATPTASETSSGDLKHSPRCGNLGLYAETTPLNCSGALTGLYWTPPPSPISGLCEGDRVIEHVLGSATHKSLRETAPKTRPLLPSIQAVISHNPRHVPEASINDLPVQHIKSESDSSFGGGGGASPLSGKDGRFAPSPLKVGHGVAMMEESVELGVPDVITQA